MSRKVAWRGLGLAAVVLRDKVVDSDKRLGGTGHKGHLDKTCGLYLLDIPLHLHTHTCGIVVDSLGGYLGMRFTSSLPQNFATSMLS